jgi:histone H3/H4
MSETENWKIQALPLARIKKIMKSEEFVIQELEKDRQREAGHDADNDNRPATKFMISGEAPLLMSKACELLIRELSSRAWQHTERNRRRTLQRQDLHAAVGESEVYDFLIDIVPRVTPPNRNFYMNNDNTVTTSVTAPNITLDPTSALALQQQIQQPLVQQQPQHIQIMQQAATAPPPPQMMQPQMSGMQIAQAPTEYMQMGLQDYSQNAPYNYYMQGMSDDANMQMQQQQQQQQPQQMMQQQHQQMMMQQNPHASQQQQQHQQHQQQQQWPDL